MLTQEMKSGPSFAAFLTLFVQKTKEVEEMRDVNSHSVVSPQIEISEIHRTDVTKTDIYKL